MPLSPRSGKAAHLDIDPPPAFLRLDAEIRAEQRRGGAAPPHEARLLVLEEATASCGLSGASLDAAEMQALVDRGIAAGGRPLRSYLVAAGYADAALWVARARAPRQGKPFLSLDDVIELHARVARLQPELAPGAWRRTTLPPFRAGVVPTPFWLVPREMARFVQVYAAGPGSDAPVVWTARALERFDRIRPFAGANGRTGRLVGNLLLRRAGLPPFSIKRRDARRYIASLERADRGDPWPLAGLIGRSVLAGLQRLGGAAQPTADGELIAVATVAADGGRDGLYKAIQRGRLRVVRRGRTLFTTEAWLRDYRSSLRGGRH